MEEQVYGLSIVKEILDKNNGKIDISSELGKGTEVIIRFNIKEANLEGRNSRQTLKLKKIKQEINYIINIKNIIKQC